MVVVPRRPNVLFVMSDDHAFHAMSCYVHHAEGAGRPLLNETPNIDRLAAEGARFDACFCTNALCSPSRASILTGTYSHVNGVTTLATPLDNSLDNVAKRLSAGGYATAIVGKWHLGTGPRHQPAGFDYWNVLPGQGDYHDPLTIELGERQRRRGYVTDLVTDDALAWLRGEKGGRGSPVGDADAPFFLMVHHKAPHRPWEPDEKHARLYDDEDLPLPATFDDDHEGRLAAQHANVRVADALDAMDLKVVPPEGVGFFEPLPLPSEDELPGYSLETAEGDVVEFSSLEELRHWKYQRYMKDYLRCVASVDDNLGRLLEYLDRGGLADDTAVFYTSDQGFFLGDHGWYDKRFAYEESLRMPLVVRYPRDVAPGTAVCEMVLNVDFPATFLDLAGLPVPDHYQGRSFVPLLRGQVPADWRRSFYYRYWTNGTFHRVWAHYALRTERYKLIYFYCDPMGLQGAEEDPHDPFWELFDLEADPYELYNLAGEPASAATLLRLRAELRFRQEEVGDSPHPSEG
ncbi:MAG: sulfatase [Promethearchaeota archaeon]